MQFAYHRYFGVNQRKIKKELLTAIINPIPHPLTDVEVESDKDAQSKTEKDSEIYESDDENNKPHLIIINLII